MTDHITTPRALLEQALETIVELEYSNCTAVSGKKARDAKSAIRAELAKPPTAPAWHDAPEAIALKAELDAAMKDAERYRWLAAHTRRTSEHWGWRWSIVIDGPVPKRNDCEDAFNEAIDAAIAEAEGGAA